MADVSVVMTETSDEEIFQSIMDATEACENININGGDDVDNEYRPPQVSKLLVGG